MNRDGTQQFVIVGQGRCGSNLLKFSLKQNGCVSVIGELYNKNVYTDVFEFDGVYRAQRFYETELAKGPVIAAGFKIFAHQATRKPAKTVWQYLVKKKIKVIHLERKNKVDRLISLEVANATGSFLKRSESDEYKRQQLDFPVSWWRERIKKDYVIEDELTKRFAKNPYIHVYYEDLVSDWTEQTGRIQRFLDVPVQEVNKAIEKQEFKLKSDRLKNYEELVAAFKNTDCGWMF
ncbi:sulfotransferase domain-containing protein [Halomonas sp. M20]|uniref:sulfotransferase domain-containing protein n=1 Tax=Halomonas sp. M20 TaxID=2763264 RepID=UPI001D0BC8C3|nr:sulfotransferase domain-containing protein [Halomonas sp. M20]